MGFLTANYLGVYNGTIFTIISSSAKDIAVFSKFPAEAESILLPAIRVKVLSKKLSSTHKGLYEISVEEIQSQSNCKMFYFNWLLCF